MKKAMTEAGVHLIEQPVCQSCWESGESVSHLLLIEEPGLWSLGIHFPTPDPATCCPPRARPRQGSGAIVLRLFVSRAVAVWTGAWTKAMISNSTPKTPLFHCSTPSHPAHRPLVLKNIFNTITLVIPEDRCRCPAAEDRELANNLVLFLSLVEPDPLAWPPPTFPYTMPVHNSSSSSDWAVR